MSTAVVVRGRYAGHKFIPDEPLPDGEGNAELIMTPLAPPPMHSIAEAFGSTARLKPLEEIETPLKEEKDSWGNR